MQPYYKQGELQDMSTELYVDGRLLAVVYDEEALEHLIDIYQDYELELKSGE